MTEFKEQAGLLCTLPEKVLSERRVAIRTVLEGRTASHLSPDGVELHFALSESLVRVLLEFIFYEQACCKTFTYELCFLPPHDAVTLRLRASQSQVPLLQSFYYNLLGEQP